MIGSRPTPNVAVSPSAFWGDALAIGLFAFAVRATLIAVYPFVYGGDPIIRLIESDRILLSYQLPGLQVLIYLLHALGGGVVGSRLVVAALSALAAAGLCRLVATCGSRAVAILAGLLFACNPYVIHFSTVPYQFPLVLAAVHWGLYFSWPARGRLCRLACSVCMGIACLTRYEAWILMVCLIAARVWARLRHQGLPRSDPGRADAARIGPPPSVSGFHRLRRLLAETATDVIMFGWGPLVWLAWHRGITPAGTFVIGGIDAWEQLLRPLTTGAVLLGLSGPLTVAVSVVGLTAAWKGRRGSRSGWWRFAAAWLFLSSFGLILSAHPVKPPSPRLAAVLTSIGIDPSPEMFVTPREGHLYVSLLSIVAALGVARIGRLGDGGGMQDREAAADGATRRGVWRAPLAGSLTVLLVGHGVWIAADRIERAGDDPELRTAVAVACVLDALLDEGGSALVLAKPIPREDIDDYLARARRAGGAAAVRRAKQILAEIETGPPAYQRVVVHSRFDRVRLLELDDLVGEAGGDMEEALSARDVRYCVVFDDFAARRDLEHKAAAAAKAGSLVATIHAGVGARVFAIAHALK